MARLSPRNFIDLIQKNNAGNFYAFDRGTRYLIHVNQPFLFLLHQVLHCLIHSHLSLFGAALEEISQHVLHVDTHLFDTLWPRQLNHREVFFANLDFDQAAIKFSAAQLCAKFFSSALKLILRGGVSSYFRTSFFSRSSLEVVKTGTRTWRRQQHVEDSFLDIQL